MRVWFRELSHQWCFSGGEEFSFNTGLENKFNVSELSSHECLCVCVVHLFWACPLDCWSDGSSMMRTQDWACSKPSLLLGVFGEHWVSNIKTWNTKRTSQQALLAEQVESRLIIQCMVLLVIKLCIWDVRMLNAIWPLHYQDGGWIFE